MDFLNSLLRLRQQEEVLEAEKEAVWALDEQIKHSQEVMNGLREERLALLEDKQRLVAATKAINSDMQELEQVLGQTRGEYLAMRESVLRDLTALLELQREVDGILSANGLPPLAHQPLPTVPPNPFADDGPTGAMQAHWPGKRVEVYADDVWNVATILALQTRDSVEMAHVHYEGWEASFDEWVAVANIREVTGEAEVGPNPSKEVRQLVGKAQRKRPAASVPLHLQPCQAILTALVKHRHSWAFRRPVDVEGLKEIGMPDYLALIKEPMDLKTIQDRLTAGSYQTSAQFARDVHLVFTNCYTYNRPESEVYQCALKLQKVFDKKHTEAFGVPYTPDTPAPKQDAASPSVAS